MQNKGNLIDLLSQQEIKEFIFTHLHDDPAKLALKSGKKNINFPLPAVIELLAVYQKASDKLPEWIKVTPALDKRSYEQSSSEAAAIKKSSFISGEDLLNLCGGLGVDDWAFSKRVNSVVSVEKDTRIHEFAAYNLHLLECANVKRENLSAEDFLSANTHRFTWIYADPDRRTEGKRQTDLSDSLPDITVLWPQMLKSADNIMIKASPLIGIFEVVKSLPEINHVVVLAIKNEVKEVLFLVEKNRSGAEVWYTALNLGDQESEFSGMPVQVPVADVGEGGYFYEANLALIKSGLAGCYARYAGTSPLIPGASYQFSEQLVDYFQGRTFRILKSIPYSRKSFDRYLAECQIRKANFSRRNFRQSVEELRKYHKVSDGGEDYFFFYDTIDGEGMVIHCRK